MLSQCLLLFLERQIAHWACLRQQGRAMWLLPGVNIESNGVWVENGTHILHSFACGEAEKHYRTLRAHLCILAHPK